MCGDYLEVATPDDVLAPNQYHQVFVEACGVTMNVYVKLLEWMGEEAVIYASYEHGHHGDIPHKHLEEHIGMPLGRRIKGAGGALYVGKYLMG